MSPDDEERRRDPAFEAVEEAGGGVAEGFEQAEADLIDRIGDPDVPGAHPLRHVGQDEPETNRVTADVGEADAEHSSAIPDDDHN